MVSVVSVVSVVSFRSFWSFRWFRWFRFGRFVSLFRVLVHARKNDLKMAEKQQNFEGKFKFRSIKSYFFAMYGWI